MATPIDIAAAIQSCYCDSLPADVLCCLTAAPPTITSCCPGQAWVRIVAIEPDGGPQTYQPCGPILWVIQLELGMSRCAPDNCGPLDPDCCVEEAETANQIMVDRALMVRAITCCDSAVIREIRRSVAYGRWEVEEPEGGCITSTLQVFIKFVDECLGC